MNTPFFSSSTFFLFCFLILCNLVIDKFIVAEGFTLFFFNMFMDFFIIDLVKYAGWYE